MKEKIEEVHQEIRRETEIQLEDVFILHSVKGYLDKPDVEISKIPLLGRKGSRYNYVPREARVRRQFKIPNHIPFVQFRKYLRVLERRLECRLNKI